MLKIAANAGALWFAVEYVPGFRLESLMASRPFLEMPPDLPLILAGGSALAVLNGLLRPILKLIAAPVSYTHLTLPTTPYV